MSCTGGAEGKDEMKLDGHDWKWSCGLRSERYGISGILVRKKASARLWKRDTGIQKKIPTKTPVKEQIICRDLGSIPMQYHAGRRTEENLSIIPVKRPDVGDGADSRGEIWFCADTGRWANETSEYSVAGAIVRYAEENHEM